MNYEDLLISLSNISPKQAYEILQENSEHKHKSGYEFIIKKDPEYAYYYAYEVIKGRFPEAEPYIKKNPEWAYNYAQDVIKDENFWENLSVKETEVPKKKKISNKNKKLIQELQCLLN